MGRFWLGAEKTHTNSAESINHPAPVFLMPIFIRIPTRPPPPPPPSAKNPPFGERNSSPRERNSSFGERKSSSG